MWKNEFEYTVQQAYILKKIVARKARCRLAINSDTLTDIRKQLGGYSKLWNDEQIASLWVVYLSYYAEGMTEKVNAIPNLVIDSIQSPKDFMEIRNEKLFPSIALLDRYLRSKGVPKALISDIIDDPNIVENPNIREIAQIAVDNDVKLSFADKLSIKFENEVGELLNKLGIQFVTQKQIFDNQMSTEGKATATPDFLLVHPIEITVQYRNGTTKKSIVHWIDAKNYMYLNTVVSQKIGDQCSKYVKRFGPGALIFHYGVIDTPTIPEVLLLSMPVLET